MHYELKDYAVFFKVLLCCFVALLLSGIKKRLVSQRTVLHLYIILLVSGKT